MEDNDDALHGDSLLMLDVDRESLYFIEIIRDRRDAGSCFDEGIELLRAFERDDILNKRVSGAIPSPHELQRESEV